MLLDNGEDDALASHVPREALDDARTVARRLDEMSPGWRADDVAGRYEEISALLAESVVAPGELGDRRRDAIDRVLTHRVSGPLIFVVLMGAVFQSVFARSLPAMNLIDLAVTRIGTVVGHSMPDGALRSLLVDGVIAGVGTTLTFVPQIAILFFFLCVLEDSGYMARAAFIMDRIMGRVGLSGRSFIPLMSSFACAIPGIMATRSIDNRRDRFTTIMIAPFMSCSARLPVYALLIGAFVPNRWVGFVTLPGITLFAMYFPGIVAAVVVAFALKRTVLRGGRPLYVMELPALPHAIVALGAHHGARTQPALPAEGRHGDPRHLGGALVPGQLSQGRRGRARARVAASRGRCHRRFGAGPHARAADRRRRAEHSFAGRAGRFIEPAIAPLGFDWRIGIGLITSLAAREVMVSTMATVFNLGNVDNNVQPLRQSLREATDSRTGERAYSPLAGVSLMVFYVLACQCMSTLAVVRRETNSWRWPIFMLVMMNALAWLASFAVFQGGKLLGYGA